jgi:hypothetical protein
MESTGSAVGSPRGTGPATGDASRRDRTGSGAPAGHSRPATAPPWYGGVTIGLFYAAAAVLITYTLLPLPGQRAFGAGNYWLAGAFFAAHLVVSRVFRLRMIKAARGG